MILYHTTAFGIAEHDVRSVARAQAAARRIGAWLAAGGEERPAGLVLTAPAAVAWACGGVAPPVDRTAATDLVWAVFTPDGAALITTNVEADRIREEYGPVAHGFAELVSVPWQDPAGFVVAAERLAGARLPASPPTATPRSGWMPATTSSGCASHSPPRSGRT